MFSLGSILFIFGCFSIMYNRKHLLVVLLSMEMIMLGIFMIMVVSLMSYMYEMLIFYLIMVVCEASLGLSILIMYIFYNGMDSLFSTSLSSC